MHRGANAATVIRKHSWYFSEFPKVEMCHRCWQCHIQLSCLSYQLGATKHTFRFLLVLVAEMTFSALEWIIVISGYVVPDLLI